MTGLEEQDGAPPAAVSDLCVVNTRVSGLGLWEAGLPEGTQDPASGLEFQRRKEELCSTV